ncbi:hypothetical protein AOQ84DRAFT_370141, partial [Glonium stellatum]
HNQASGEIATGTYGLDILTEYASLREHTPLVKTVAATAICSSHADVDNAGFVVIARGVTWFLADASAGAGAIATLQPPQDTKKFHKTCPDTNGKCKDGDSVKTIHNIERMRAPGRIADALREIMKAVVAKNLTVLISPGSRSCVAVVGVRIMMENVKETLRMVISGWVVAAPTSLTGVSTPHRFGGPTLISHIHMRDSGVNIISRKAAGIKKHVIFGVPAATKPANRALRPAKLAQYMLQHLLYQHLYFRACAKIVVKHR